MVLLGRLAQQAHKVRLDSLVLLVLVALLVPLAQPAQLVSLAPLVQPVLLAPLAPLDHKV